MESSRGRSPSKASYELYDYEADPGENKNLAEEKPEVVKELKAILAKQPEAKPQVKAAGSVNKKARARRRTAKKVASRRHGCNTLTAS